MGKIVRGMNKGVFGVLLVLTLALIIAIFCQVFFRFVFGHNLTWTEELSRYSLVWITFLGAAYAMATNSHVGMEMIVEKSPLPLRRIIIVVGMLVSALFFIIMIQQGYALSMKAMKQLSPVLKLPMGYIYAIIPISGVILLINLLDVTWKQLKGKERA